MLTITTPQGTFPARKIGCLNEGCEASFLVFNRDPLQDLSNITDIEMRIKDGGVLR